MLMTCFPLTFLAKYSQTDSRTQDAHNGSSNGTALYTHPLVHLLGGAHGRTSQWVRVLSVDGGTCFALYLALHDETHTHTLLLCTQSLCECHEEAQQKIERDAQGSAGRGFESLSARRDTFLLSHTTHTHTLYLLCVQLFCRAREGFSLNGERFTCNDMLKITNNTHTHTHTNTHTLSLSVCLSLSHCE